MFLINLYESSMNQHIRLDDKKYDDYNAESVDWYKNCRAVFFEALENITVEEYLEFAALNESKQINATMKWLAKEKQELLFEKCEAHKCGYKLQ